MKYAILGDLHGCILNLKRIKNKLKQCQTIFITGDITGTISYSLIIKSIFETKRISRERYTELVYSKYLDKFTSFQIKTAKKIFKILTKLNKPIFFTHGNSDTIVVREYFEKISKENSNLFYVGNSLKIYKDMTVIGYGFCSPAEYRTPFQTPGEKEKEEIRTDLAKLEQIFYDDPSRNSNAVIGLFHEPPFDTELDFVHGKSDHGGSSIIKKHILKIPYNFVFSGHIHESQGYEKIKSTLIINPGALVDRNYAILNTEKTEVYFFKLSIPLSFKELIYRTRTVFE